VADRRPLVLHLTTVDMSLAFLLLPQLVAFKEAGYRVVGVSAPGPYVATLEEHGIEHVPLPRSTRARDLRADLATALDFFRICRRLRPDIVHTHNPKPGVYGRIGARLAGVSHVVNTVHGLYAQPTDGWRRRAIVYTLERVAASFSDAELLQNPEDLPVLRRLRVPAHKLHLLGNGVDLTRFDPQEHTISRRELRRELGIDDETVVVGLVGRLVREKGYPEVFDAARRLRRSHPHVRFLVAGPHDPDKADAVSEGELHRAADEAGVVFLGMRDDVERLYAGMDLYLLASHREGFPRAAMEAAAMALPVIATDIRGCRQVVDHERTGLLVPVRDVGGIVAAVERLAEDAGLRAQYGAAAHEKALAEFDDQQQIARTLALYDRLLGRVGSAGTAPGATAGPTEGAA
jgi:glycosyltransferase involved in cell wall biosynthesis